MPKFAYEMPYSPLNTIGYRTTPSLSLGGGNGNSSSSGSSNASLTITPNRVAPPEEPDMSELLESYGALPGMFSTRGINNAFDRAIGESRTTTAQMGRNAEKGYASRLTQAGIAPIAAGVVGAQARRAGNANTTQLMTQKEVLGMEARKKQADLSALIANSLASIRNDYTKTLADFHSKQANLKFSADSTNAANNIDLMKFRAQQELIQQQQLEEEQARAGADRRDVITPGYIPSFGPITPATINGRTMQGQVFSPASIAALGYRIG